MTFRPIIALAALALVACGDSQAGDADATPACPAGALNCPCQGDGACDDGLACTQGFCVPVACPDGAEGCACHADGSCDAKDGQPMRCEGGACRVGGEIPVEPGGLGDPCDVEAPCGLHEGVALVCAAGVCALPGCAPGAEGCACEPDAVCDPGLVCEADVCVLDATLPAAGLKVSNPAVRACGLVLPSAGVAVHFADGVLGRARAAGDQTALAFTATADAPFDAPIATLQLTGEGLDLGTLAPTRVECFDRLGQLVASPGVALH